VRLKLIYSHGNVMRPILAEAIVKTGVLINILEAKVTPQSAEMVIEVTEEKREEIIDFLRNSGVKVKQISKFIELDRDRCISCGACVSPCPVEAIKQDKDWQVHFNESKCIGCRLCIPACPLRVIEVL
jgi:ferredoxin